MENFERTETQMSASREKQNRQEQAGSGYVSPKTAREAEQRKAEKRSNVLYAVIGVVFAAAVVASVIWNSNIISRSATAVTIDGENYNAAEVTFYYQSAYRDFVSNWSYFVSYLGLNTSASLESQTVNDSAASMLGVDAGITWKEYFLTTGINQMATIQGALKAAQAEGFVYPASVQAQYDAATESLAAAAKASNLSETQYLQNSFGSSVITAKVYKAQLLRMLQYEAYANAYQDSLTYSASELESAYAEDPNSYDKVAYEAVTIVGTAESTTDADGNTVEPTEEESAAAQEAAKAAADQLLADYRAGGDLETLGNTLGADNSKINYVSNDGISYSSGSTLSEWLFDSARRSGDSAVLENGSTYYVAVFHDRFRDETKTIDVRHILIQPEAGTLSEGDEGYEAEQEQLQSAAKAKAEELYAQWQAGEATEESFAALAMEESADGSRYDGGLYTQVYQGQMVTEFNDWCFDPARKSGDTGIVETTYGYHIMYFVGDDLPYWQVQVSDTLKSDAYSQWLESLSDGASIQRHDFGMRFVA